MAAPPRNCRGFTLLELLVALAMAVLIMAGAYTTLFSLSDAQERASAGMEQWRALRNTMDLLRRELASAMYQTNDKQQRFLVEDRDIYGKPASRLLFSTLAPPSEGLASDQIRVRYYLEETDDHRLVLKRGSEQLVYKENPDADYPLLEPAAGFLVECYNGGSWVKTWDTDLTHALPKAVRVTITVPDGAGAQEAFQLIASPRITAQ